MSDLNTAIQLIRQGNTAQAQKILETIVRTETNNVPAWLWYAQTWPSNEMRLKVLTACLKLNPGDEKALQAVKLIKGKMAAQPTPPAPAPVNSSSIQDLHPPVEEQKVEIPPIFAQIQAKQPQPVESRPIFNWDELEQTTAPAAPAPADELFPESKPVEPEPKAPGRSYNFYEVWWIALTNQKVAAYAALLDDPEAKLGRAIEWQVYTNLALFLLSGLISFFQIQNVFATPEFQELRGELPMLNNANSQMMILVFLIVFILLGVFLSVMGLLINGAFQNFLAHAFGGTGNFSRTVYALSAYLIPISVLATVMGFIPFVNCLAIGLSMYAIVLNVRALQAAHGLNGGRATIIVFIPTLIVLMLACAGFTVISSWVGTALRNYGYPTPIIP